MSDHELPSNVRPFPSREDRVALKDLKPKEPPVTPPVEKLGVYPLADDVIVSKPLFLLIVTVLERPDVSQAERTKVAQMMRKGYEAPWG